MPKALHKPPTMRGGKEPQKSRTKLRTIYIASPPAYSVWSGPLVANRHTHKEIKLKLRQRLKLSLLPVALLLQMQFAALEFGLNYSR